MAFALGVAARFMAERTSAGLILAEDFAGRDMGELYGPGLAAHGLDLDRLVFVRAPDAPALFQAMEEALRSGAPAVVVGEVWRLKKYDLAISRRLLLAARAAARRPAGAGERLWRGRPDFERGRDALRDRGRAERASTLRGERARPAGRPTFAARLVKARLTSAQGRAARPRYGADHPPHLAKRGQKV